MDEHNNSLDTHVVIDDFCDTETIKAALKIELRQGFNIAHSTLEFDIERCEKPYC
ncbi:MAG: hypothetical protein L3J89_15055 [Gammaproteobacteria bacterium]|nr:hypothetical protein [Gammaproteobacteria bacterium]